MSFSLLSSCSCGKLQAALQDVSPPTTCRNVCCCEGCQRYAHWLERADELLDEDGGTEVFQISPKQLEIIEGAEQIACVQLTPKGALRWYTKCCQTPIGNTLPSPNMPFLALPHLLIENAALSKPIEAYFGPVRATINGRFPRDKARERKATGWSMFKFMLHYAPLFFKWKLRGDHKHSPFYDTESRQPICPIQKPPAQITE